MRRGEEERDVGRGSTELRQERSKRRRTALLKARPSDFMEPESQTESPPAECLSLQFTGYTLCNV